MLMYLLLNIPHHHRAITASRGLKDKGDSDVMYDRCPQVINSLPSFFYFIFFKHCVVLFCIYTFK